MIKRTGFTLLEVTIVIVIIGAIAITGFVNYGPVVERNRTGEAEQALINLFGAQRRHFLYNGSWTNDINDLDIALGALTSYNAPAITVPGVATDPVATLTRSTGAYTLRIDTTGTITCVNGSETICSNLGY